MDSKIEYYVVKKKNEIFFYRNINKKKDCFAKADMLGNNFQVLYSSLDIEAAIFALDYLSTKV